MKILLMILLGNAASFIVMRAWWQESGSLSAKLVRMRRPQEGDAGETVFLIAGNLAQPKAAFKFLAPQLQERRCAALCYKMIGWSALETARTIVRAAGEGTAVVYAISLGDQVARHLETLMPRGRLKILAINPCPSRMALRKWVRWLLTVVAPVFWVVCHLLGWLSVIPMIPATGGKYSLILLADQYMALAYGLTPWTTTRTRGVILSQHDKLLDNRYLKSLFKKSRIIRIPTKHGDTVRAGAEYLRSVNELLDLIR